MATKKTDEDNEDVGVIPVDLAAPPPPAAPFVVPPQQNVPPTEAQMAWLRAHPAYQRISHAVLGRSTLRGTLSPDGVFVAENIAPVSDGAGSFGVGIPVPR